MKSPSVHVIIAKQGVLRGREEKLKEGKREGRKEREGGEGKQKGGKREVRNKDC